MDRPCKKLGVSILELLVVFVCIGILLALSFVGVQAIRESSRQLECQNNFHQVITGLQTHVTSFGHFPGQSSEEVFKDYSVFVYILPLLEQDNLQSDILKSPVRHEYEAGLCTPLRLKVLMCPSSYGVGSNIRVNTGAQCMALRSHGFGGGGAFEQNKKLRTSDFTDGLSNTAMLSERIEGLSNNSRGRFFIADLSPPFQESESLREIFGDDSNVFAETNDLAGHHWIVGDFLHTWYNHVDKPNAHRDGCLDSSLSVNHYQQAASVSASSFHRSGVNVALADGSVRFVTNQVDIGIWTAVSTRSGSEVTGEW